MDVRQKDGTPVQYATIKVRLYPTPAKYKTGAPFWKGVDNQALTQEYNKLARAFRVSPFWSATIRSCLN